MNKRKSNIAKRIILSIIIILIVVSAGVLSAMYVHNQENGYIETSNMVVEDKKLSLIMAGDNLIHTPLIANAKTEDGGYNFDSLYQNIKPYIDDADISVIVQETILGGAELGYSGYPMFNSPQEVGDAVAKAGFDVVLSATNHTLDRSEKGILNTIEFWKKYPKITVLGINETEEDYYRINYINKNGIKLAVLNYTDSTNGMSLPKSKKFMVNTVDREKISTDLKVAEENADFTVVFMHWGTEYRLTPDNSQQSLALLMTENGADLIMGSHPHVIEPVEWVESENGNKSLVYYSLGNYVSRQKETKNLLGALGSVTIRKDEGKTYIDTASILPIVTHYNFSSRGFSVYPLKDYTDELAAKHGVSQYDGKVSTERFWKIFDSVFTEDSPVTIVK